jgi:hypothetical protein
MQSTGQTMGEGFFVNERKFFFHYCPIFSITNILTGSVSGV